MENTKTIQKKENKIKKKLIKNLKKKDKEIKEKMSKLFCHQKDKCLQSGYYINSQKFCICQNCNKKIFIYDNSQYDNIHPLIKNKNILAFSEY